MSQLSIIFVPGKNPKPAPKQHIEILWRTLAEGVERAAPEQAKAFNQLKKNFKLIDWNYLFYNENKDISADLIWIDALMNSHGPSEEDIREANSWHRKLNRFIYHLADMMPFIINWLPHPTADTITETNRYFHNEKNIGYHVREQLKKTLRPLLEKDQKVLLIGHSLGSVIAYDTLWEMSHLEHNKRKVDLLTLGSPLGMNYVQHRLQGHNRVKQQRYPLNIRHWYNVASVGDVTALDQVFKDDFKDLLELGLVDSIEDHCHGIYNFFHNDEGLNCHRSYGYLVNPAVGKIIADWWQNNQDI